MEKSWSFSKAQHKRSAACSSERVQRSERAVWYKWTSKTKKRVEGIATCSPHHDRHEHFLVDRSTDNWKKSVAIDSRKDECLWEPLSLAKREAASWKEKRGFLGYSHCHMASVKHQKLGQGKVKLRFKNVLLKGWPDTGIKNYEQRTLEKHKNGDQKQVYLKNGLFDTW